MNQEEGGIAIYQNTVLIYNPAAGKMRRSKGRIIARTLQVLEEEGIRVTAIPTHGAGTATEIAREAVSRDIDLVLVAGGDGTVNEVVNGMAGSHVPLGVLPAGTANVLAVELGLGTRIERAARRVTECVPERVAIGRIHSGGESRYFLLMAGVGLDAHIVYDLNLGLKDRLGKLAYWVSGFGRFRQWVPQFQVQVNGAEHQCGFVLASRVRNYGGDLTIASNASFFEDDFEVVLFRGRSPLRYVVYFLGVLMGTLPSFKGVAVERTRRLDLCCADDRSVYVQVDGEFAGRLPARIEIVEDGISLLMPADARMRLAVKVTEALLPAAG